MSDPFVDALHDRLSGSTAGTDHSEQNTEAALTAWWVEFVEVLGQKVGAWNERQAPKPPLNFTRRADGAVHVWHRSAEGTFVRRGDEVRITTRLGGEHQPETLLRCELTLMARSWRSSTTANCAPRRPSRSMCSPRYSLRRLRDRDRAMPCTRQTTLPRQRPYEGC